MAALPHFFMTRYFAFLTLFTCGVTVIAQENVTKVTSVEGITEYRLANGAQVLLFPDESKSMVTVNMTVFVGSRHEGYGEAGMAHLLEHMLFKGTPSHERIPELMKNKGAKFNGTTWLDRTNYYETLPASNPEEAQENLEFAIRLEADRLMNSYVRGEDLASEMTVVRNEFERGENNPQRVLMQRMQAAAYEWHNYGRTTIGNQSDIERVPIDKLKAFYRKFYRPDNIMVVVAGKFDPQQALELVDQYFGALEAPAEPLDRTYTTEPAQDGERTIVLRRVGNVQLAGAMYHAPSGANREYAAVEMLAYIFGTEPSGRLYRDLVEPELASDVSTMSMALHDPGLILFTCKVPTSKSIESARQAMLQSIESVADHPITAEELKRAQTQFAKQRELRATETRDLAIELSEWAAQGDWRLYFLFRDYVESLTPEEVTQVASDYLTRNNRTVGLFIPSESSDRVAMPAKPNLEELLAGYEGRGEIQRGEAFDPSPLAIQARVERGSLDCGLSTAWLPKKTRGGKVNITLNLRFGNEQSLQPYTTAMEFMPELMMHGTRDLDYQQLQDRLDELKSQVSLSGTNGLLRVGIETTREQLEELLPLIGKILREPRFAAEELEVLRRQAITATEASMTEPTALAALAVRRALSPFDEGNIRYVPSLEERVAGYREVTIEQIRELHAGQLNGSQGEVTAVGDFDPQQLESLVQSICENWTSSVQFARIPTEAQTQVPGRIEEIQTPDKASAVYYGGTQIKMRDDDPDYPALLVANYVLGGGSLSSRLGDRVRQKEGLSYGVGSGIDAHPVDARTNLTVYAITNPENKQRLVSVMREEMDLLVKKGITMTELQAAQDGLLKSSQLQRTDDGTLANILSQTIFANRDMGYYAEFEEHIAKLTIDEVNAAVKKYFDPERLVICLAGDFEKAEKAAAE